MTTTEQSLVIGKCRLNNFMRLEMFEADLNGSHLLIEGPNTSGKTSILEGIWSTLSSRSARTPEPVHRGAKKAVTHLELLDRDTGEVRYILERHFTAEGNRLVVSTPDGQRIGKAQEVVDNLFDEFSLDISLFLKMRPQDQVDEVLRICEVLPPVEQVKELTSESFPPRQGESASTYLERLSADETGLFYQRRRDANRAATQKQAALDEHRQNIGTMGDLEDIPEASATDLVKRIDDLQQLAQTKREADAKAKQARFVAKERADKLAGIRDELTKKSKEIQDLQERLDKARAEATELEKRIFKVERVVAECIDEAEKLEEVAAVLSDPATQIQALRSQLAESEKTQARRIKQQQARQQLVRLEEELAQAREYHASLDFVLAQLRALRGNLLNGVDLGVQGLEIGDGELRLNGVSFKQASHAEKIRVACGIAFRRDPSLKIVRLDDAEHLDGQSQEILLNMANQYGWQCILAFVRDGEGLRFEIVEAA